MIAAAVIAVAVTVVALVALVLVLDVVADVHRIIRRDRTAWELEKRAAHRRLLAELDRHPSIGGPS